LKLKRKIEKEENKWIDDLEDLEIDSEEHVFGLKKKIKKDKKNKKTRKEV